MDAPRTRYKVVERGRRLEVVDTWNGDVPVRAARPAPAPPATRGTAASLRSAAPGPIVSARPPRLDQRGQSSLQTRRWYDDKGPRRIALTAAAEARLKGLRVVALAALFTVAVTAFLFWPLLFVVPFFVMNGATRKNLRAASTRFLDGINQPLTGSSAG